MGREVTLDVKTTDRYCRTVPEVTSDIKSGLAMVEDGQVITYRQYLSQCNAREVLDAKCRVSRSRYEAWHLPGGITRLWGFRHAARTV